MDTKIASEIEQFLKTHAQEIESEATLLHKKYLKTKFLETEYSPKYQQLHRKMVTLLAEQAKRGLDDQKAEFFREFGEKIAHESVKDGLTLEEAVNGTIFLRQAMWINFKKYGLLEKISSGDAYTLNQTIGVYIDILVSKISFVYHQERLYIENNLNFLADASKVLSSSLDYQTTLNTVASLAVPTIGDWCAVDLLSDGEVIQVAVAHKDPEKIKWAKNLRKLNPVDLKAETGIAKVLKTGKSEIYPLITDEMLVAVSKSKEQLKLFRKIGFTSAMIVPITSKEKKAIGVIMFVTTETRRQYTESDLLMAEELATRASVAIENARLYKGSIEAITVRDEFISVASHELKTPVTSVKMFTQVLRKHSEQIGDKKAVNYLSKMDRQINNLTELIYDLLNVSKIQAGKMEFKKKKYDFDASIKETIDVLQQSSEKHKLIIKGKTGKSVVADEERIGQVLNNLISNAVKYSPHADMILIKLSSTKDNVRVDVQDFGIGMEENHLNKIFERFYRVYDNNDKTFPGLGIGLYICAEIIKRHGGKFSVSSKPGLGSVFSFSLPIT